MKDRFIDNLSNTDNGRKEILHKLSQSNLPIVIYGAGLTGMNIYYYLKSKHLPASGFMVDLGYGEGTELFDLRVETIEYYNEQFSQYNVVIALNNLTLAVRNLQKNSSKSIGNVFSFCDSPEFLGLVYDKEFVQRYESEIQEVFSNLADEVSKITLVNYVDSIISNKFNLNLTRQIHDPMQYFPKDIKILSEKNIVVDCGAYNGDTLLSFRDNAPQKSQNVYFAIEPDINNCALLLEASRNECSFETEIINKGVWDKSDVLSFSGDSAINASFSSTGNILVEVEPLDNILSSQDSITLIKMDLQGAELRALEGAKTIIKQHKPCLAICIYHKPEDIFEIPFLIKNLVPDYRFYIRHHDWSLIETVLYAVI